MFPAEILQNHREPQRGQHRPAGGAEAAENPETGEGWREGRRMSCNPPCKVWRYQFILGFMTRKGAWQSGDEPAATSSSVPCLSLACFHIVMQPWNSPPRTMGFHPSGLQSPQGTFVRSCQVQNAAVRVELEVDGAAQGKVPGEGWMGLPGERYPGEVGGCCCPGKTPEAGNHSQLL